MRIRCSSSKTRMRQNVCSCLGKCRLVERCQQRAFFSSVRKKSRRNAEFFFRNRLSSAFCIDHLTCFLLNSREKWTCVFTFVQSTRFRTRRANRNSDVGATLTSWTTGWATNSIRSWWTSCVVRNASFSGLDSSSFLVCETERERHDDKAGWSCRDLHLLSCPTYACQPTTNNIENWIGK